MKKMAEMQIPDQATNGCALHPYMFHPKHEANSEPFAPLYDLKGNFNYV